MSHQLFGICNYHWAKRIKTQLRKAFKDMFRGPEYAYAALDFTGRGFIFKEDILNSKVMQHLSFGIKKEDVKMCFVQNNLFSNQSNG